MSDKSATLRSAIFAGICIGVAGFGYLAEKSIVGAVTFSFGLLTVVHYGLKLYTGTAGFIGKRQLPFLATVLAGNIIGCLLVSLMLRCSPLDLQHVAEKILRGRLASGPLMCGVLSVGCGMIMTTAVNFARKGSNLPLFFGVPLFIICGFPHCVADAFYYLCASLDFWSLHWKEILPLYVAIVCGNFVGCNLYRIIMPELDK